MRKKAGILFLLSFFSTIILTAENKAPIILGIDFIEDQRFESIHPPSEIRIGIQIREKAYYKFSCGSDVIGAGLFIPGLNVINIEAGSLFNRSGVHVFLLEVKVDDLTIKKIIEIDIQLSREEMVPEKEVIARDIEYDLALFIDDELIASNRQKHYEKFPIKIRMPEMPQNMKAFDPAARDDPAANSFSILSVVALAYKLAGDIKNSTSRAKYVYNFRKKKVIITDFMRKEPSGGEQEVTAVLRLSIKDEKL